MIYLPSLLEYSDFQLQKKIDDVKNNLNLFSSLQDSNTKKTKQISFHLDFVLPQFAKDRKVMTSIGLKAVLEKLKSSFIDFELDLSIHLMATVEDLIEVKDFFEKYEFIKNWKYIIFVDQNYTKTILNKKLENVKIGIWCDLGSWSQKIIDQTETNNFLLMTVLAGKSGQKLEPEIKQSVLKLVKANPQKSFIIDGGWSLGFEEKIQNLQIVSYSGFWKVFLEKLIKNKS
jgi:pentose-5-phosphate-3-epimerase